MSRVFIKKHKKIRPGATESLSPNTRWSGISISRPITTLSEPSSAASSRSIRRSNNLFYWRGRMKRVIFKHNDIKEFWWPYLVKIGKFDCKEEVFEADYCFACGHTSLTGDALERAHIQALVDNGPDCISNIHLLCSMCHSISEYFTTIPYFIWFVNWNINRLNDFIVAKHGIDAIPILAEYSTMSKKMSFNLR